MLESIEIRDVKDKLLVTLPVAVQAPDNSYVAYDVEGLGPVKADVTLSTYSTWDGGVYESSRTGDRNIVFKVKYKPNYATGETVQSLRRALYDHLQPKREVHIRLIGSRFYDEQMWIKGVIESHEPVMFEEDPDLQISIICPEPHFYTMQDFYMEWGGEFEYDGQDFGEVETGFTLSVFGNPNVSRITIKNGVDPDIIWDGTMGWNDTLLVSTVRGDKYIKKQIGNNTPVSALDGLLKGGLSMTLGDKKTKIDVKANVANTPMIYQLRMQPKFVGF